MHSEQDRRLGQLSTRQMEVEARSRGVCLSVRPMESIAVISLATTSSVQWRCETAVEVDESIQQTAAKVLDLMKESHRAEKQASLTIDGNTKALAIAA